MRFVKVMGFGNATEPASNDPHKYRSQTGVPGRTGGVQKDNWVIQTLESRFREVLKILGIVLWKQVFEGWHQPEDRNLGPLFFQNNECRIHERLEVRCEYEVLTPRLIDEVGDTRGRIPRRNSEGDTFGADDSELDGGICDRV